MDLSGARALVTGAASGIGEATARALAGRGCAVTVADVAVDAGRRVAADIGGSFWELDVADPAAWRDLDTFDIAHLNAGIITPHFDVATISDDDYRRVMAINVDGVVFGTRALATTMPAGSAIVATASAAGLIAYGLDPIYNLTKHAVVGFVRGMAMQLTGRGITLNAVCPGVVDTPILGEGRAMLAASGFPLIDATQVADAVLSAVEGGRTGEAWLVTTAGNEVHEFPDVMDKVTGGHTLAGS